MPSYTKLKKQDKKGKKLNPCLPFDLAGEEEVEGVLERDFFWVLLSGSDTRVAGVSAGLTILWAELRLL